MANKTYKATILDGKEMTLADAYRSNFKTTCDADKRTAYQTVTMVRKVRDN